MPDVAARVAVQLRKALVEGYGADFTDIDFKSPDFAMLSNLERNVYSFSVAKNYQELKQATDLLKDGDRVRNFNEFKAEILKLHTTFNKSWLQSEYSTAVNGSELAARWGQFQQNKEAMPNLIYQTAGDSRVRDSHRALDGVKRPVDDDFWKTYYPPNGWNCRCTVNQSGSGEATPLNMVRYPEVLPLFQTNLAQAGLIYPKGHPYYEGIPAGVIKNAIYYLPQNVVYRTLSTDAGNTFEVHMMRNPLKKEIRVAGILADDGNRVKLLPEIDQHETELRKLCFPEGVHENKNPDAIVNQLVFDFKTIKGSKKSVQHVVDNLLQSANYAIEINEGAGDDILRYMKGALMHKVRLHLPFELNQVWIISNGKISKYTWEMKSSSFKATKD